MTRLGKYLEKIEKGKAVNYKHFLRSLPGAYRVQSSRYFTLQKADKGHIVTINETVLPDLQRMAEKPVNRVEAAVLGDSHRVRLDETFLLAFHETCPGKIPDVVYLSDDCASQQRFTGKASLLLLENEKNFFCYTTMFKAMKVMMGISLNLTATDVAFAQGAKCTSELVMSWVDQYEIVFFAADLDLGGLRMFGSLSNRLGNKVRLVLPESYERLETCFRVVPEKDSDLTAAIKKARSMGFDALAQTLFKCRRFMEQETLLSLDSVIASDSQEDCNQ